VSRDVSFSCVKLTDSAVLLETVSPHRAMASVVDLLVVSRGISRAVVDLASAVVEDPAVVCHTVAAVVVVDMRTEIQKGLDTSLLAVSKQPVNSCRQHARPHWPALSLRLARSVGERKRAYAPACVSGGRTGQVCNEYNVNQVNRSISASRFLTKPNSPRRLVISEYCKCAHAHSHTGLITASCHPCYTDW
jgi:hypothetical protein